MLHQSYGVCDNTCGMLAHQKDGRIKWLEGNPADVLGGDGKICVKGTSAMRTLYDPDRLKWPLKRTNPNKGKDEDPGWVRITWEEAFSTIGAWLRTIAPPARRWRSTWRSWPAIPSTKRRRGASYAAIRSSAMSTASAKCTES